MTPFKMRRGIKAHTEKEVNLIFILFQSAVWISVLTALLNILASLTVIKWRINVLPSDRATNRLEQKSTDALNLE